MGQQLHLEQALFSCYSGNKPAWQNMQSKSIITKQNVLL